MNLRKRLPAWGGSINAYTTPDLTAYTNDIPVAILDMVLGLEADRMQNLVFDEKETLAEQKVVLEERRMRLDNIPLGAAYESELRALFKYHPYGIPTIGYPQHIAAYTNDSAKAHYATWYVPNNAVLIVSGDVTMEQLLPLVKKHFDKIPGKAVPKRQRVQEPEANGIQNNLIVKSPRISYVSLEWYFNAPNFHSDNNRHYYPLTILAQILGGNAISRFYDDLVDKRQLAIGVNVNYDGDSIDPKHFSVSVSLHPNHKPEDLKAAIEKHIQDVVAKGITEKELIAAKRDILANLAFAKDGTSSAINIFSDYATGMSVEDIESGPAKIEAVTVEQVNQAAKAILGKMPVVTIIVYPENYSQEQQGK